MKLAGLTKHADEASWEVLMSKVSNDPSAAPSPARSKDGKPKGGDARQAAQTDKRTAEATKARQASEDAAKARKALEEADKRARDHAATRAGELAWGARAELGPLPFATGETGSRPVSKGRKNEAKRDSGKAYTDADIDRAVAAQLDSGNRIQQVGGRDTCAAAEAQHQWAMSDPKEYARVAKELMKTGEATIVRDGQTHVLSVDGNFGDKRNSRWIAAQGFDLNEKLNATMQAAVMNFGVGGYLRNASYDMGADRASGGQSDGNGGMSVLDTWRLINRLSGQAPLLATSTPPDQRNAGADGLPGGAIKTVDDAFAELKAAAAAGEDKTVLVGASKGTAHMVRVVDVKDGKVTIQTPDGLQSYSESEFKRKMDVDTRNLTDGDIGTWSSYSTTTSTSGTRTRTTTTTFTTTTR
jgi:hypothetical protein